MKSISPIKKALLVIGGAVLVLIIAFLLIYNLTCLFGKHHFLPANYQSPSTCSRCGLTEGDPLTADFVTYDLADKCTAEFDTAYPYTTQCEDGEHTTTGTVTYSDYRVFDDSYTHEGQEGYLWIYFTINLEFTDANALAYGVNWTITNDDYYDIAQHTLTLQETNYTDVYLFTCNYNGTDYEQCLKQFSLVQNEKVDNAYRIKYDCYFLVPEDYDGICVAVRDTSVQRSSGSYVYSVSDSIDRFLRLKADSSLISDGSNTEATLETETGTFYID